MKVNPLPDMGNKPAPELPPPHRDRWVLCKERPRLTEAEDFWYVDRWGGLYVGLAEAIEYVTLPNRVEPLP